jgi:hypothetical protein
MERLTWAPISNNNKIRIFGIEQVWRNAIKKFIIKESLVNPRDFFHWVGEAG